MKQRSHRRRAGAGSALSALRRQVRSLSFSPRGFRDLIWCGLLNEPAILEYRDQPGGRAPWCPNCNGNYELGSHPFIAHIRKP